MTHVDVVRVEVVRDVRVDTCPTLECLELELWLGHVRAVKVEVAQLLGSSPGVVVRWVESLVARWQGLATICRAAELIDSLLDKAYQSFLLGEVDQRLVVRERLRGWFRDQNVVAEVQGLGSDGEVGRVGGEDDHGGSFGKSSQSGLV
jgi:hypothetical protein